MVGDSRPCDDIVQLGTKVDRVFKILVFTKSKEIRSNDVHVKLMMLNAIHVTLSMFSTSITQSWAFKKHFVKRKRKFCNQNYLRSKRKRKIRNQNFLR